MTGQGETGSGHIPVLLEPVLEAMQVNADGFYIDATYGRGGHSDALLRQLGSGGRLLAIDRDPEAFSGMRAEHANDPRFEWVQGQFSEIEEYAGERNLLGKVDGVLFDLGVSSPQLDDAGRGFSFRADGHIDMRMDPTSGISAADWLHTVDERQLRTVIRQFGEERFATRIAAAIVSARTVQAITSTVVLADIIAAAVPVKSAKRHPATKTFQAIRMFINDELGQIERALKSSLKVLSQAGRLCVISFHSLEDRMVKRFIRQHANDAPAYRGLPDIPEEYRAVLKIVQAPVTATDAELAENPRARSARLRVAERL